MADFLQRMAARFGYSKAQAAPELHARRFEAAVVDRLTASWRTESASIDRELRTDLDRLRARSRDLFKNNEYARKFGRMVSTNIVGQGFVLQSQPMETRTKVDQLAADAIESAWGDFCKPRHCDVRGVCGLASMLRLAAKAAARDGEGMLRIINASGKYGVQLQVLDIDRLDTQYNRAASGAQPEISMGIERNADGKPLAYHLFRGHPNGNNDASRERERVPATQILHFFVPEELEQSRGVPWMHAAMRRLNDLGGYREAAVIAARIGASKMGFFQPPDGDLNPLADGTTTGRDGSEQLMTQAEPGEFGRLPPGWTFSEFNPQYPHEQFDAFTKACLRGIASGMGVSYNSLANDLEGVNFSSIRSGVLEERDNWLVLQDWFIEQVLDPIFDVWLDNALLLGAIVQQGGSALPATKRDKFRAHKFQGRRWGWVDPVKDVQAAILAIEANLTTTTDVAAKNGVDFQDVLATKQRETELYAAFKITPPASTSPPPAQPPADTSQPEDQAAAEDRALMAQTVRALANIGQRAAEQRDRPVEITLRQEPAAPAVINVNVPEQRAPDVQVNVPEQRAPEVVVHVAAPTVNVAPADVNVQVEATLPAPEITLNLPARRTETQITRDSGGRISQTVATETDAV